MGQKRAAASPRHSRGMVAEALGVGNCRDFGPRNVRFRAITSPGGRTTVGRSPSGVAMPRWRPCGPAYAPPANPQRSPGS